MKYTTRIDIKTELTLIPYRQAWLISVLRFKISLIVQEQSLSLLWTSPFSLGIRNENCQMTGYDALQFPTCYRKSETDLSTVLILLVFTCSFWEGRGFTENICLDFSSGTNRTSCYCTRPKTFPNKEPLIQWKLCCWQGPVSKHYWTLLKIEIINNIDLSWSRSGQQMLSTIE